MNRLFQFVLVGVSFAAVACAGSGDEQVDSAPIDAYESPRETLQEVFLELVRHGPTSAVFAGDRTYDAELDDIGPEALERHYTRMHELGEELGRLDPDLLGPSERFALDVASNVVSFRLGQERAQADLWEVSGIADLADGLSLLPSVQVLRSTSDLDNLISRYQKFPRLFQQRRENLEAGAAQGLVASRPIVERAIGNLRNFTALSSADGSPFAQIVIADGVSEADRLAWTTSVNEIVDATVSPALLGYADYLETKLLPDARTTFGYGAMGQLGADYYLSHVDFQTNTTLTPQQIHELGVTRVAELDAQLRQQLAVLDIDEPVLSAGLAELAQLPESQPGALAEIQTYVADVNDALLATEWAGAVWGVEKPTAPMYDFRDAFGSPFYIVGSSTITFPTRGVASYFYDSILTHEVAHYFQDVVRLETSAEDPVSPFLPLFGSTVIAEGAAHYAEVLALDSSLYEKDSARQTALVRIGALNLLMLRAVRLVVDTGIHAMGWERDQAVSYMKERVAISEPGIEFEVDRYASLPGQALAYRLGMEVIAAERARAEGALGPAFSPKEYNRMVLGLTGGSGKLLQSAVDSFIMAN